MSGHAAGGAQLVADIGGTHARFAYVSGDSDTLHGVKKYPCEMFPRLVDALNSYMASFPELDFDRICLALPGPVEQAQISLPNNPWMINSRSLEAELGMAVTLINDFSAQVLSIAGMSSEDLFWLSAARPEPRPLQPIAVLGAGTGLGVAAMTPDGYILPSEGGHVGFAPTSAHEAQLLAQLWQRYPRVSVERLLSGMGLANLYWANCRLDGIDDELSAPEVTAGARAGDRHCQQAVADFSGIMGAVAGDAALMIGALGGVYLSGGILPQMLDILDTAALRRGFLNKGRFSALCETIPLAVVLAQDPGLMGCVRALRMAH